ncbi:hypothetical protein [Beduini massiliensis]|uniref:hypothetical protein n=1 Tax=Beduini massiliensis TaxID=1585974 RepID=UPI00059A8B3A|nr:hypothetical protein [Beduini massiliensis]
MDDLNLINTITKEYELGPLTKEPERLYGGFMHKNYLVTAKQSKWVIKFLIHKSWKEQKQRLILT